MNAKLHRQHGVTLIELMVAIVIASLLAIAVTSVLVSFEGRKRSTTSVNDINQTGNYAAWVIDNLLRSAGSGFVQTAEFSFGCKLYAAKSSVQILPVQAQFPAPFTSLDQSVRLAPVLIAKDATTPGNSGSGSDALVIMSGASGKGEAPAYLTTYPSAAELSLKNTLPFSANDLVLVADQDAASTGLAPCMLTQVGSSFAESGGTSLALAGDYYAADIASTSLAGFTKDAVAMDIGNVSNSNPPAFNLLGVGDSGTLYSYDLLQSTGTTAQAVAQGVFEMHALYGLDTNSDGKVDSWVKPEGSYAYSALTSGSVATAGTIATIKAIRVGLVLRTDLLERDTVSPASITLFTDLGSTLAYTLTISGDNTRYRYRTVEITVPLRNAMLLE